MLDVVFTKTSRDVTWFDLRIQKPRAVIGAPPVLYMEPLSTTELLSVLPLVSVSLGRLTAIGAPVTLAVVLTPAELIALTLNVCVEFDKPVNVCDIPLARIHVTPLRDTS